MCSSSRSASPIVGRFQLIPSGVLGAVRKRLGKVASCQVIVGAIAIVSDEAGSVLTHGGPELSTQALRVGLAAELNSAAR